MCERIIKGDEKRQGFALSPRVIEALCAVDREVFVPDSFRHLAYELNALPLVYAQWISSPFTVAQMSEYIAIKGGDSVLEIGCGSGYQAMVLSKLFRRVFSIERIDKLLHEAKERFKALQSHNIFTKLDDGQRGWEQYAPFDAILFSACASHIPSAIISQLAEGGVLVAPMVVDSSAESGAESKQVIKRFIKQNGALNSGEVLNECKFVPILDEVIR